MTCPLLNVSNSVLNTTDLNYTTAVRVVCNDGYAIDPLNLFNNSIDTVCTRNANWSTFPIVCQRKLEQSPVSVQEQHNSVSVELFRSIHWTELEIRKVVSMQALSTLLFDSETTSNEENPTDYVLFGSVCCGF